MPITARRLHGPAAKALREALGISLRGMARDIGRDPGYLSRIERGTQTCSPGTTRAIADRLGVGVDTITYVVEQPEVAA